MISFHILVAADLTDDGVALDNASSGLRRWPEGHAPHPERFQDAKFSTSKDSHFANQSFSIYHCIIIICTKFPMADMLKEES